MTPGSFAAEPLENDVDDAGRVSFGRGIPARSRAACLPSCLRYRDGQPLGDPVSAEVRSFHGGWLAR
jgi:hypothetical protein